MGIVNINIEIGEKVRVFISSICGVKKYDSIRAELKKLIDDTGIAKTYLFEGKGKASSFTAQQDYLYGVDDSDICVFLIDNADGVPEGVLKEHQRAKSHPKKSIYLFCDENEKQPTNIQQEITEPEGVKYHVVSRFQDFLTIGYSSLIDNIVSVYLGYCRGRLIDPEFDKAEGFIEEVDIDASESFEKQLFKNMDKTSAFITEELFNRSHAKIENTSDLDTYCLEFLKVLFGKKTIKDINTSLFLLALDEMQSTELHSVVVERWKAIQYYWMDNLEKAIESENKALKLARELQLPNWLIQDILIDLRTLYFYKGYGENVIFHKSAAQVELDDQTSLAFYPFLDRYDKSLYEGILNEEQKNSKQSPYTITWGNNIDRLGGYISNAYIMAFFNGSLTHILRTFDKIKDVAFSLCSQYDDWEFRITLLKMAIIKGDRREVESLIDLYNDVYGKMNAADAKNIYRFLKGTPICYQKDKARLHAFQHLGYYFSDEDYLEVEDEVYKIINDWVESDKRLFMLKDYVFGALKANTYRLNNQIIIEIILRIFEKELSTYYDDVLDVIGALDYKRISDDKIKNVIERINLLIVNEDTRKSCYKLGNAIILLRKKIGDKSVILEKSVMEYMGDAYKEKYSLEILVDSQEKSKEYIKKYITSIRERNNTQGKGGKYTGYANNPYDTIINIIHLNDVVLDNKLINSIVGACKDTLYAKTQLLSAKVEAIKLIIFLGMTAQEAHYDLAPLVLNIIKDEETIFMGEDEMFLEKTSKKTLFFNFIMMKIVYNISMFDEVVELLGSHSALEEYEKLEALKTIISAFDKKSASGEGNEITFVIFQFALQLSYDKNHDIRYYAVKALLHLINDKTKKAVMRRISEVMDFDSVYIKNMILSNLESLKDFDLAIYEFIKQKANVDNHYVIRNWAFD